MDPKTAALAATRSLNPHPEKVTDEVFLASIFCDPLLSDPAFADVW
jgi:hypothetical protein